MEQLKPREKLLKYGASTLSDSELLAIFLRTGVAGVGVLTLAENLLHQFGELYLVMTAPEEAFRQVKGIGKSKLSQLYAITELARRCYDSQLCREGQIKEPEDAYNYLVSHLAHLEREVFKVIFLDNQHHVISAQTMFMGTISCVEVHPREIIREALKLNAAALILAHNHPSGIAEPSEADKHITRHIEQLCNLMNIRLLDHFVIGRGEFVSFAQRGLL